MATISPSNELLSKTCCLPCLLARWRSRCKKQLTPRFKCHSIVVIPQATARWQHFLQKTIRREEKLWPRVSSALPVRWPGAQYGHNIQSLLKILFIALNNIMRVETFLLGQNVHHGVEGKKPLKIWNNPTKIWTKSSFFVLRLQNQNSHQFSSAWSHLASAAAGFEPSVLRKLSEYKATPYQCQGDRRSRAANTSAVQTLFLPLDSVMYTLCYHSHSSPRSGVHDD